jgi:hypothetical protein
MWALRRALGSRGNADCLRDIIRKILPSSFSTACNTLNCETIIVLSWNDDEVTAHDLQRLFKQCIEAYSTNLHINIQIFSGSYEDRSELVPRSYFNALTLFNPLRV